MNERERVPIGGRSRSAEWVAQLQVRLSSLTCFTVSGVRLSDDGEGYRAMRLGLFGGTFDPIHVGHLILAEQCRESCGLDRVWFVVAGLPPHKLEGRTAVAHRLEMVRIAIAGHSAFEASEIEAVRPGPHYSVETLESVHRQRPGDDLFFLIGGDSLADLPFWREPGRIAQLATIVVVNRPGIAEVDPASLPDFGSGAYSLRWVSIPPVGIASTDLRRRLAAGKSVRYMVPRGVEAYIDAHGLYRAGEADEKASTPSD